VFLTFLVTPETHGITFVFSIEALITPAIFFAFHALPRLLAIFFSAIVLAQ